MQPLADRLRPKTLEEYIGQSHIIGPDKLLHKSIKSGQIFSMILWGPPGVGKTTLARIIANELEANFLEFSAVNTSTVELKKVFESLSGQMKLGQHKQTVMFIDEIHRFNKSQQDAFLPFVENGTITLIGATTENPSFEVIGPLLSRSRVFVLEQLSREDLEEVVKRALKDKVNGLGNFKVKLEKTALDFLIEASNGDARQLLNALEIAVTSHVIPAKAGIHTNSSVSGSPINSLESPQDSLQSGMTITKQQIEEAYQKKSLQYDKTGEEHYNTISAFIKSMRASNIDAALYYLARMIDAGEDPKFIARRMVIFASEDIGMAQPTALVVANEVFRAVETIGYPEAQINLAHGVVYLASAKKDRSAYEAYLEALSDVKQHGNLPIPMNIRNAPTKLMKDLGYGAGYEKYTDKSLLPEKLKEKKYYKEK